MKSWANRLVGTSAWIIIASILGLLSVVLPSNVMGQRAESGCKYNDLPAENVASNYLSNLKTITHTVSFPRDLDPTNDVPEISCVISNNIYILLESNKILLERNKASGVSLDEIIRHARANVHEPIRYVYLARNMPDNIHLYFYTTPLPTSCDNLFHGNCYEYHKHDFWDDCITGVYYKVSRDIFEEKDINAVDYAYIPFRVFSQLGYPYNDNDIMNIKRTVPGKMPVWYMSVEKTNIIDVYTYWRNNPYRGIVYTYKRVDNNWVCQKNRQYNH